MLKIGITGGIGSGKSVVSQIFRILNIPVIDADAFAKELMNENQEVKQSLLAAFGPEIFTNDRLNRKALAQLVFNDKEQISHLNQIVHPAVKKYGNIWLENQDAPYVMKEAALFFESNSYQDMDYIIGVSAPEPLRLKRAMQRDQASEATIRSRMNHQMNETEKMERCDFIIYNDEEQGLIEQVVHLHQQFIQISNNRT